jgi:hypothetical protein
MNKQMDVNHRDGSQRRSWRQFRTLFLSGGLMAAVVAGPAFAKSDAGPPPSQQQVKKKKPSPAKACIDGPRQTRYISHKVSFSPDASYVRVTWEPRFCRQGGEWTLAANSTPSVQSIGPADLSGIAFEVQAPHFIKNGVQYTAHVRKCTPLSISVQGIGTSGSGCYTAGVAKFSARVVGKGRVRYGYTLDTTGWVKKLGGGKLVWTDKVV